MPVRHEMRFLKDNRGRIPVFLPFFSLISMAWVTFVFGIEIHVPALSARSGQFLLATPVKYVCFAMTGANLKGKYSLTMTYLPAGRRENRGNAAGLVFSCIRAGSASPLSFFIDHQPDRLNVADSRRLQSRVILLA